MLWTACIFLCVSLGIFAGYQVLVSVFSPHSAHVRQRLAREFKSRRPDEAPLLFKNAEELSLDAVHEDPRTSLPIRQHLTVQDQIEFLFQQAHLTLAPGHVALIMIGLGAAGGLVGYFVAGLMLGAVLAVIASGAPLFLIYLRIKKRRDKMLEQLPGAFELMARVLRAGSSIQQAILAVTESMENPLSTEFSSCQKQLDLGMPPEVTYEWLAYRCPILELRIFAMGMMIQRQTGGNLSDVLERLATMVRARLRVRQQVRTLTAEGRLQGWVLIALPFFVFAVMTAVNYEYAVSLFEHPGLLILTGVSMLVGVLWIRKIVNFEP